MAIQIESELKEILERIEKRFDDLAKTTNDIDKRLIKVETKLDSELPAGL